MVFLMYDIYISYMYYQFCLSQMGKKWFLWMSHYHARYKSEEISPPCFATFDTISSEKIMHDGSFKFAPLLLTKSKIF